MECVFSGERVNLVDMLCVSSCIFGVVNVGFDEKVGVKGKSI